MVSRKKSSKVKIREDLQVGEMYGDVSVVPDMIRFRGEYVTIHKTPKECEEGFYTIQEDYKRWAWTEEMFE